MIRRLARVAALIGAAAAAAASAGAGGDSPWRRDSVDGHVAEYLAMVATLGAIDPDSVDFQPGSTSARAGAPRELRPLGERSRLIASHLMTAHVATGERGRSLALAANLQALAVRSDQLRQVAPPLDAELRQLQAINLGEAPLVESPEAEAARAGLERLLPGTGPLAPRLAAFERRFVVPRGRLDVTARRALDLCRARTLERLRLPGDESVAVEYVAEKPWSAFSLYKGGYRSVVQINRAVPHTAGRLLTIACHEGYPGHHTINVLREERLVRSMGWPEAGALLTFSPDGFDAEAAASAAPALAFTTADRAGLFREELFPLAGIPPDEARRYADIEELVERLSSATSAVVLRYLARQIDRGEAAVLLRDRAVMSHPDGLLEYVDRYRGYALAYTWGRQRILDRPQAYIGFSSFSASHPRAMR